MGIDIYRNAKGDFLQDILEDLSLAVGRFARDRRQGDYQRNFGRDGSEVSTKTLTKTTSFSMSHCNILMSWFNLSDSQALVLSRLVNLEVSKRTRLLNY